VQRAVEIVVNPIVLGELQAGFLAGAHRRRNDNELRVFLNSPRVSVAAIDSETAFRYAEIWHFLRKAGTPIPTNDIWIAATAMQYGLRLLTTDGHYRQVVQILVEFCASPPTRSRAQSAAGLKEICPNEPNRPLRHHV